MNSRKYAYVCVAVDMKQRLYIVGHIIAFIQKAAPSTMLRTDLLFHAILQPFGVHTVPHSELTHLYTWIDRLRYRNERREAKHNSGGDDEGSGSSSGGSLSWQTAIERTMVGFNV